MTDRNEAIEKALRALCVAVEYKGVSDIGQLPDAHPDSGMGYEARVPEQFIIDARTALELPQESGSKDYT